MKHLVLDCSMAIAWCLLDERNEETEHIFDLAEEKTITVPSLWFTEVASALLKAEQQKRCTKAETQEYYDIFLSMNIEVDERSYMHTFNETTEIARKHNLSAYDATYLELAIRNKAPLATLDKQLQKAAKDCGVNVL